MISLEIVKYPLRFPYTLPVFFVVFFFNIPFLKLLFKEFSLSIASISFQN